MLGQPLDRLLPEVSLQEYLRQIRALGATAEASQPLHATDVLTAIRANGDRFPVDASISRIQIGEEILYTVILRDLTERQRLEAQLIQAQKMESVGHLAGGIAHDFNNLLMAILGYTDLIREGLPPESLLQQDVAEIRRAGERANDLTRQLLAFARKQVISPRVQDLGRLLEELRPLLRRLISESVEIVLRTSPQPELVKVDPGQIEQVLLNLAVNASDAMPEGGTFTIGVDNIVLDTSTTQHLGIKPGKYVQLTLSDTGTGMTEEVQKHIFEPFFTTKEPGKGTGLGLATCYGIVKQHGGAIVCESKVGQGTTFKIYLPALPDASPAQVSLADASRMIQGTETVLLVEDEPTVRSLIGRVLRTHGYNVLEAGNGAEALAVLLHQSTVQIDLVLTDMVMPGMSGAALAERVQVARPNAKVVFMSGYNDPLPRPMGPDAKGAAFLQKPVLPRVLLQKVREVLDA